MKEQLASKLEYLLVSARGRHTNQGVRIYEAALQRLGEAEGDEQISDLLSRLKAALIDIDTHGAFLPEEYECVKNILEM